MVDRREISWNQRQPREEKVKTYKGMIDDVLTNKDLADMTIDPEKEGR